VSLQYQTGFVQSNEKEMIRQAYGTTSRSRIDRPLIGGPPRMSKRLFDEIQTQPKKPHSRQSAIEAEMIRNREGNFKKLRENAGPKLAQSGFFLSQNRFPPLMPFSWGTKKPNRRPTGHVPVQEILRWFFLDLVRRQVKTCSPIGFFGGHFYLTHSPMVGRSSDPGIPTTPFLFA